MQPYTLVVDHSLSKLTTHSWTVHALPWSWKLVCHSSSPCGGPSCIDYSSIVRFVNFFKDEDNVYMTLELRPNGSLINMHHRCHVFMELEARFFMGTTPRSPRSGSLPMSHRLHPHLLQIDLWSALALWWHAGLPLSKGSLTASHATRVTALAPTHLACPQLPALCATSDLCLLSCMVRSQVQAPF